MAERVAAVERRDIRLRPILTVGGVLLFTLALVAALVGGLLRWWRVPTDAGANAPRGLHPAGVALQPAPQDERAAYDAAQGKRLHGYGWVDRGDGIARIPVELAMEMLIAQGGTPEGERRPPLPQERSR